MLLRDGAIVPLTPKVFDTLAVLVEGRGEVVSKSELLQAVWPDTFVEEGNLAQNISILRKALGQDRDSPAYVETVPKRGYRFVAEVTTSETDSAAEPTEVANAALPPARAGSEPASAGSPAWLRLDSRAAVLICVAVILCGALAFWYYNRYRAAVPAIHSIAVLPLRNLSGDPAQDYFVDGITELLTTELSRAIPLRVTSRTSAMHYRNSDKPLPIVGRELNVDAVLEGSVVRSGDRLRITAQLIYAPADQHIWAATYDREITDLLVLQQEIARALAHELQASVAPGPSPVPVDRSAFDNYLRARYYLDQRTAESIPKAISLYGAAIAQDPAYARAYAGLADCYNQLGTVMIGGRPPLESRRLAMAAASRALEIDPQLAEAHAALAYSNLYDWNWDRADEGLQRAISLNPNYAPAHLWYAHYLAARLRFDEALQQVRLARDLDPLSPIIQTQVGWILGHAGRFPEAIAEYRKALDMQPGYQWAMWQLGGALRANGDLAGAIQVLQVAVARDRTPSGLATLGETYGLAGQRSEAEKILKELLALSHERYVPPHCFVTIYCGLRDREKTFEWLEQSYAEHSNSLLWMRTWPDVDWLRSDPRFANLLSRVGL